MAREAFTQYVSISHRAFAYLLCNLCQKSKNYGVRKNKEPEAFLAAGHDRSCNGTISSQPTAAAAGANRHGDGGLQRNGVERGTWLTC